LTAAALTQTYFYIIENGLEYSKLATGKADIFLQVKEDKLYILYYYLAEPNIEAEVQSRIDILLCRTAVSQMLTFCLIVLASKPHSQRWRNYILETACRAVINHETILQQIPAEEKALTLLSSVFQAQIYPVEQSPIILKSRKSRKARRSCNSTDIIVHEDLYSPSSSSDKSSDIEIPSKPTTCTVQSGFRQSYTVNTSQAAGNDIRYLQYCTQACLLGLVQRRPLDKACPNVSAHRAFRASSYHILDQKTLVQYILYQLIQDPDACKLLRRQKQGARGTLFRLTLDLYRYTFVGKGTVVAFKAKLKYKGSVYCYLNNVQGELIPVYLGNILLLRPYFLDIGVRIIYILLMS
jgi:hypothetical protein